MIQFTPTSLVLFGLTFHWYGVIIATGMALAVALACARERRLGLPKDTALDLALLGIPMAIVCARLYYVVFSWREYAANPIRALYIWEGGMAIYGGIIGLRQPGSLRGRCHTALAAALPHFGVHTGRRPVALCHLLL